MVNEIKTVSKLKQGDKRIIKHLAKPPIAVLVKVETYGDDPNINLMHPRMINYESFPSPRAIRTVTEKRTEPKRSGRVRD